MPLPGRVRPQGALLPAGFFSTKVACTEAENDRPMVMVNKPRLILTSTLTSTEALALIGMS